jgi:predicted glycoside hydrolase/deacetylase ChbG (UPF0249 family)
MKYLIVNADDFGASRGINRGILEAHQAGILTSTSLLVHAPGSEDAARLSRAAPALSVGLHTDLGGELAEGMANPASEIDQRLRAQFERFQELMARPPTHLDSHHNVHRDPRALPHFLNLARQYHLPLREHSPVRYFSKFYGQWGGATHWEQISAENLAQILQDEIGEGITELSCHPGYVEPGFQSSYGVEREAELRALCAPRLRGVLSAQGIQLVSYHDLDMLVSVAA